MLGCDKGGKEQSDMDNLEEDLREEQSQKEENITL